MDAIILIGVIVVYFIPTIIAWNKRNADAIIALNFFLGWTFIGWVGALVWALTKDQEPTKIIERIYIEEGQEKQRDDSSSQSQSEKPLTKEWTIKTEKVDEEPSAWDWLISKFKKDR